MSSGHLTERPAKLMGLLRRKISDKMLLRLIRRYLSSGMLRGAVVNQREEGTPQGGPLSPLLSNILLDELDKELESRGHHFIRYADDVSIFKRSKRAAHRVRASITRFLNQKLLLTVNDEKTSICRPVKFKLLGHGFVVVYKKGVKGQYRLSIAPKSWSRLKMKTRPPTQSGWSRSSRARPVPFHLRIASSGSINSCEFGFITLNMLRVFRN